MSVAGTRAVPNPTEHLVLHGVRWATYVSLLEDAFATGRHLRFSFDRGFLEVMTLSPEHERLKKLLARMIEILAEEMAIPIRSIASTTLNREAIEKGLEPDECYYIRNESAVRGRDDLDLEIDPVPDLAVEVEISRGVADRERIYAALGVPELWRCDRHGVLRVMVLEKSERYVETTRSPSFPFLDLAEVQRFLDRRNDSDETTWIRSFHK